MPHTTTGVITSTGQPWQPGVRRPSISSSGPEMHRTALSRGSNAASAQNMALKSIFSNNIWLIRRRKALVPRIGSLIDRYILGARVAPVAVVAFSLFLSDQRMDSVLAMAGEASRRQCVSRAVGTLNSQGARLILAISPVPSPSITSVARSDRPQTVSAIECHVHKPEAIPWP
jgi:hypothetical protein